MHFYVRKSEYERKIIMCVSIVLITIVIIYFISLKPNTRRKEETLKYTEKMYAHRGLYNINKGIPENTLDAFFKAVEKGCAIELDLHVIKDDRVVVFHDDDLLRSAGVNIKVKEMTYSQLLVYSLFKTKKHIPVLEEALEVIDKKVPILIEIKPTSNTAYDCKKIMEILDKYDGKYCIESFDPRVLWWFRKNRPQIIRGQLSSNLYKEKNEKSFLTKFILSNLMLNFITKPDFVAYNKAHKNNLSFFICSKVYKTVKFAWTIRSKEELDKAKKYFDGFIFEKFEP